MESTFLLKYHKQRKMDEPDWLAETGLVIDVEMIR
jgi:hypothetical protein